MPQVDTDGLLIAETSETGDISWVWLAEKGNSVPRPLPLGLGRKIRLERFDVYGATRAAISAWMAKASQKADPAT